MCIIIAKPVGKPMPTKEILRQCWANNPDGAGYMFTDQKGGSVVIRKPFFRVKSLLTALKEDSKRVGDSALVIHFRISTGGQLDKLNTHPHRISKDLAYCHNGILWTVDGKSKDSDTVQFRNYFLAGLNASLWGQMPGIQRLIEEYIGKSNKFVFLRSSGEIDILNETSGEWVDGIWYSNGTYEKRKITTESAWNWSDFYPDKKETEDPIEQDLLGEMAICDSCYDWISDPILQAFGFCDKCGEKHFGKEHWEQEKNIERGLQHYKERSEKGTL